MPELVTIPGELVFNTQQILNNFNKAFPGGKATIPINIKDGASLPLGRITGQTKDFDKALQAATDRVVAFGAAAGAFTLVAKGVKELAAATIEVQDSLIRIGANFNRSDKEIKQFGATLFDIARQTGTTFSDAAKGAEELARQGLSIAETQKRLKDALVLSRISGTDVNDTIQNLTATLLTFNEAGLDSTKIINKLVAVDVSAAVSAKDLQEAFARVGSSAADAGVSFDQLLSLITVVKERTGRDGPVIGNALKTIFTRLEDTKTLEVLRSVGVEVQDIKGHTLPAVQILTELAKTYKTLGDTTQATVAKQVAGGFQVNILKSLLGDLSKETTRYSEVLQTASNASDEATQKNEKFNTSLKATLNATSQSIKQIFAAIGETSGGNLSGVLNGFNDLISKGLSSDRGSEAGKTFAQGMVDGISNVLTGPALLGAVAALTRILFVVTSRVGDELQGYLNINSELRAQAALQAQIAALQENATKAELAQLSATASLTEKWALILALKERIAATNLVDESAQIGLYNASKIPHVAGGYLGSAIGREVSAIRAGVGGATSGAKPVVIPNFNGKGPIVANTDEYLVPNHAGGGMSVYNRDMAAKYGLPGGSTKISGPVGNYATARDSRGRFLPGGEDFLPNSYQAALKRAGVNETEIRAPASNLSTSYLAAVRRNAEFEKSTQIAAEEAAKVAEAQRKLAEQSKLEVIAANELQKQQREAAVLAGKKISSLKRAESFAEQEERLAELRVKLSKEVESVEKKRLTDAKKAQRKVENDIVGKNLSQLDKTSIIKPSAYAASPQSLQAYLTTRQSEAGKGKDYKPVPFDLELLETNKSIKQITLINQAAAKLKEGTNFGGLSKDERGAFVRGLRQQGARELYGSKFTLETLQSNPDAEDAIRKFVEQKVASFSPKRPISLNSFFGENLSVGQKLLSKVGVGDVEKQLEKLIANKGVNGADAKVLRDQILSAQQTRTSRFSNLSLGATFALPFVSGFLPEGKGGTAKGQALGALSGAAQGAGYLGLLGPYGLLAGGIIGGFIGAMSKATKSLGEFQEEIDKTNSRNAQQIQSTTSAIEIGGQYQTALKSGDKSGANKLLAQLNTSLGGVADTGVRNLILSGKLKEAQEAAERLAISGQKESLADKAAQSIRSGLFQQGDSRKDVLGVLGGLGLSADDSVKNKLNNFASDTKLFQGNGTKSLTTYGPGGAYIAKVANLDKAEANLADLKDTLVKINPAFKDLNIDLSNAQEIARLFSTALAQGVKAQEAVTEGLREAAKSLKLTGFLTGGLEGTGNYGKYGAASFALGKTKNRTLSQYNKNENFLGLITELGGETTEGKFPNADVDPTIRASKADVQRKNLLQRSAEFLGSRSGRPDLYFKNNGLASESSVISGLQSASTQGDAQSKLIAKFLYEKLKISKEDVENTLPKNVPMDYRMPADRNKPTEKSITYNGRTYAAEELKPTGNNITYNGKTYSSAELDIDRKNNISPQQGRENLNTVFGGLTSEIAKLVSAFTGKKLESTNKIDVNVNFSADAIKDFAEENRKEIIAIVEEKLNEAASLFKNLKLELKSGIPTPPSAGD